MKKIALLVILTFFLVNFSTYADFSFSAKYSAKTGDKSFDTTLGNLNAGAKSDRDNFISDLSLTYGVPKIKIQELMFKVKMAPADVYMTIRIADLIRRPIDVVVGEYKANRGKGWGVIAKNLGIKPGSAAFHALKSGASASLGKVKANGKLKAKNKGKHKI